MTIATWPTALPRPERTSWSLTRQDARLKLGADAGPPRYRRRFSAVAKLVSLSIVVDRNGKAIFNRFFADTTEEGALLFYMPDPTTDGWVLYTSAGVPLLKGDGTPLLIASRWLCAWGDQMPTETIIGVDFRISFSIAVMP